MRGRAWYNGRGNWGFRSSEIRVSAGGTRIRLRLTNEYGTKPLLIGAAWIALSDERKGFMQAITSMAVMLGTPPWRWQLICRY